MNEGVENKQSIERRKAAGWRRAAALRRGTASLAPAASAEKAEETAKEENNGCDSVNDIHVKMKICICVTRPSVRERLRNIWIEEKKPVGLEEAWLSEEKCEEKVADTENDLGVEKLLMKRS